MKTNHMFILTSLLLSTFSITTEAPAQTPSLWDTLKQAYQYVTENPQIVDELKKQWTSDPDQLKKFQGQASSYIAEKKDQINLDKIENSELNQKLQARWKKSGTDKSYIAWVASNPSEIVNALNS